jgi:hypothetical protein
MFAGNDIMGYGQALAGSLTDLFGSEKKIKNLALDMFGNAFTGIGDLDFDMLFMLSCADSDPAFFSPRVVTELFFDGMGGINDQVQNNLADFIG